MRSDGSKARQITNFKQPMQYQGLSWGAESRWIAFSAGPGRISDLYLVDTRTRKLVHLTQNKPLEEPERDRRDWWPTFSPNGQTIAFMRIPNRQGETAKTIYLIDVATKRLTKFKEVPTLVDGLTWHPDGKTLLSVIGGPDWMAFQFIDVLTKQTKQISLADLGLVGAQIFYAPSWTEVEERGQGIDP